MIDFDYPGLPSSRWGSLYTPRLTQGVLACYRYPWLQLPTESRLLTASPIQPIWPIYAWVDSPEPHDAGTPATLPFCFAQRVLHQIYWDHLHSWDRFLTALVGRSDWDYSGHHPRRVGLFVAGQDWELPLVLPPLAAVTPLASH